MTGAQFSPRAQRELRRATLWIAAENTAAARVFLDTALAAADHITGHPHHARARPELASERFRFWSLRGFPYLLVLDTGRTPPVIARLVHQSRDLPVALTGLDE